jgi:hypothetical protein
MTPNLIMSLDIEPICLVWNGVKITLSGKYELLPDNQIKHLHKRVLAVAHDDNVRIPFYGRIVGKARKGTEYIWLVEDEKTGKLARTRKPEVVE